jgi:exosortase D (VPLPA-CTERM-specific)
VLLLGVAFQEAIRLMVNIWLERPEYSHGILIPLLSAFLVWQRADELAETEFTGSWAGVALVAAGAMLHVVGKMATLYVLQQYALVAMIYGVVLAYTGAAVFRSLWMPLLLLVFMIPLPEFLLRNFSAQLQLVSSQIGVWVIRLFGISVYLEGNVIDLGQYKLQVAEACDGLRYLFPLMTLGFVMAYFFKAELWKRVVLFLSSIPITILMNSFRIGVIGVTVEHWGVRMAEGFLHEFQGWVVFMASTAILFGEVVLLSRIGPRRAHWRDLFAVDLPRFDARRGASRARTLPPPLLAAVAAIALYAAAVALQPQRVETIPMRASFTSFPDRLGPWKGRSDALEPIYLHALKLNDYLLADFTRADAPAPVNMYVAWYDSQRAGQSAHSPRSCLPGGGWRIDELDQVTLPGTEGFATPLRVNRVLIGLGNERQLVYYWFQQRGRVITNEYLVKWYLFLDAIGRQRTDGALVRLTTPLLQGEDPARGDARLAEFAAQAVPRLTAYVPE